MAADSAKLLNMLEAQLEINRVQAARIVALEMQRKHGAEKSKKEKPSKKAKKDDKPKKSPTCTVCKLPMKKNDHSKCKKAE